MLTDAQKAAIKADQRISKFVALDYGVTVSRIKQIRLGYHRDRPEPKPKPKSKAQSRLYKVDWNE